MALILRFWVSRGYRESIAKVSWKYAIFPNFLKMIRSIRSPTLVAASTCGTAAWARSSFSQNYRSHWLGRDHWSDRPLARKRQGERLHPPLVSRHSKPYAPPFKPHRVQVSPTPRNTKGHGVRASAFAGAACSSSSFAVSRLDLWSCQVQKAGSAEQSY